MFYLEKFSTCVCRFLFAVKVTQTSPVPKFLILPAHTNLVGYLVFTSGWTVEWSAKTVISPRWFLLTKKAKKEV